MCVCVCAHCECTFKSSMISPAEESPCACRTLSPFLSSSSCLYAQPLLTTSFLRPMRTSYSIPDPDSILEFMLSIGGHTDLWRFDIDTQDVHSHFFHSLQYTAALFFFFFVILCLVMGAAENSTPPVDHLSSQPGNKDCDKSSVLPVLTFNFRLCRNSLHTTGLQQTGTSWKTIVLNKHKQCYLVMETQLCGKKQHKWTLFFHWFLTRQPVWDYTAVSLAASRSHAEETVMTQTYVYLNLYRTATTLTSHVWHLHS